MNKKIQVGLDLTKTKIKKFDEFLVQESVDTNIEMIKKSVQNIGLDLVNDKSGYKIDISKYGKDIE